MCSLFGLQGPLRLPEQATGLSIEVPANLAGSSASQLSRADAAMQRKENMQLIDDTSGSRHAYDRWHSSV